MGRKQSREKQYNVSVIYPDGNFNGGVKLLELYVATLTNGRNTAGVYHATLKGIQGYANN